jgi:hypothetical protein
VKHPDVHTVGIRAGKRIQLGGSRNVEVSAEVFNLLNAGNFTDYTRNGANRIYSPSTYLQLSNPQTPRALQTQVIFRF